MNKVVIISHDALTPQTKKNFFIDEFANDGVEIEYWCVREMVNYARGIRYPNELKDNCYTEVMSLQQLKSLVFQQPKATWFCIELWFNWDTLKILKVLKPFKNQFRIDWYCNIPQVSLKKKIKADIRNLSWWKLLRGAWRITSRKIFVKYAAMTGLRFPYLFFVPGKKSIGMFKDKNVIALRHHDLEFYQNKTQVAFNTKIPGKYAVFLDNMLPFHSDFIRINSYSIDADVYFKKLNTFFDEIEKNLNLQVIIAAHPKSSYTQEFDGRTVLKGLTNELVERSSLVLAHHSTAINYSVLNCKKLVLIYSNEFLKAGAGNYILQNIYDFIVLYAQHLNCSIINIDKRPLDLQFKEIDLQAYRKYLDDYVIGSQDESNYSVIKKQLFPSLTEA